MARDSHVRKMRFFAHSDPHGAELFNGGFLAGMPDDDLLNGPSLDQKEEVEKFLLAVVARFKAFKKRMPSNSFAGKRPQRASASKAKSSVLSELLRLRPRPNPLFYLSVWVWRMFYSMISSSMSSTQKMCQSRGPLPLFQILFQQSRRKIVLHVKKMRWLR